MANPSITLITGGNTGIGYETVKALYASPQAHTILMGSRSLDKAHEAISKIQSEIADSKSTIFPVQIDIEDDASIENAFKEVESKFDRVDSLVNNAGASFDRIMLSTPGAASIREAFTKGYSVNVTSTHVFTHHFAPLLLESSSPRLLFVTSGLSSLTNTAKGPNSKLPVAPPHKGWPKPPAPTTVAHRCSKTALNMVMLDWVRVLQPDGVKVFGISPGFLATGLGGMGADVLKNLGAGDPSIGGSIIRDVVEGKRDGDVGTVVSGDGVQPW